VKRNSPAELLHWVNRAQARGHIGQLRAVSGDGQVFQLAAPAEARQQAEQVLARQRLTSAHANALNPKTDKGIGDTDGRSTKQNSNIVSTAK
jgi:hypothetical protein